jgi:hypothetical protein
LQVLVGAGVARLQVDGERFDRHVFRRADRPFWLFLLGRRVVMFFGIGLAVQEEPGRTAAAAPSTSTSARMMMISFLLPPPAGASTF